ncbi:MAG: ribonuclease E/G [Cellulosilyticaceae bacterium]
MDELCKKQIIIDTSYTFTKIGFAIDQKLEYLYTEHLLNKSIKNQMVIGQIQQVMKNLNSVFVDYGEEKKGLLPIKQIPECYKKNLHQGMRIPVQIKKENTGDKGNKLTSFLTLEGNNLICFLFEPDICFSKKIKNNIFKTKIKEQLSVLTDGECGFLIRTRAEQIDVDIIIEEAKILLETAKQIKLRQNHLAKGSILNEALPLAIQVITEHLEAREKMDIICNNTKLIKDIKQMLLPYKQISDVNILEYDANTVLFSDFSLEKRFESTMKKKVWLKNGSNIVFNYTEALTVIDVNSAKAVLSKNKEKTFIEINQLAIEEAFRQIRLRNLGGMFVVDLLEMNNQKSADNIFQYAMMLIQQPINKELKIYPITPLGLLQIVKEKKYTSFKEAIYENCEYCGQEYGQKQLIWSLYQIENQFKRLSRDTIQKKCYIKMSMKLYELYTKLSLQKVFEQTYNILAEISVDKSFKPQQYEFNYHN